MPDEVTGKAARDVIPEPYRAEVVARLEATLQGKKQAFEAVRGSRVFEARMSPIYSGEPLPVAVLVHLYDITARKQQALALEAERTRFRALVDNAPVGVFEMDANGNALYVNDLWLRIVGLDADAARHPATRTAGIHPDDRTKLLTEWALAKQEGRGYRADFRYQVPGGPAKRLSSVAAPLRRPDGTVSGFISVMLDRTVELENAASIERSLREKETLLKEIHHRVKNNLQVIGSIIGLQASRAPDGQLRSLFLELRGRVHAIAQLHERLYRSQDLGAIELVEYLRGLVTDAARAAGASADRVSVRAPDASLVLGMDECVSVGLIVNELVSNAFKHGCRPPSNGRAEVALRLEGDVIVLDVSDDGPGFPEGFAPGRVSSLGMLLLRNLARHLGGEISFNSRPTRVTLRFSRRRHGAS
jgi:PAS domain S-box-containing protein